MENLPINVYLGKFGVEQKLCMVDCDIVPRKGDLIFYDGDVYKVLYAMLDIDNDEYSVFVRLAVEEDF